MKPQKITYIGNSDITLHKNSLLCTYSHRRLFLLSFLTVLFKFSRLLVIYAYFVKVYTAAL